MYDPSKPRSESRGRVPYLDTGLEQETESDYYRILAKLSQIQTAIESQPYSSPLYIIAAQQYSQLGYPDLAVGSAYKALLLSDSVRDESDEYHEPAVSAIDEISNSLPLERQNGFAINTADRDDNKLEVSKAELFVIHHYLPVIYKLLIENLMLCGGYQSAFEYHSQAARLYPGDDGFRQLHNQLLEDLARQMNLPEKFQTHGHIDTSGWPDRGFVRRERYPWNDLEPNRLQEIANLNRMMSEVAPKLEVLASELPDLTSTGDATTVKQLGVFAKVDIQPGEVILNETSLLTANNKLQDALCDACSAELPELQDDRASDTISCTECEVVFCSERCYEQAMQSYHPALCDMDVESIAKDVPATQAADSLYSLLLLRTLAMAHTQNCHPLELAEVKYIWGDFHNTSMEAIWSRIDNCKPNFSQIPQKLPFSFEQNIRLPFHMLEKMGIDIFANPQYDVWVFNTLYAKFRGTASARLSGLRGRAIRGPEVGAVHPMWCLANHSCDPNVKWEWGGSIKFSTREDRVAWWKDGKEVERSSAGIKKGEEVLSHYCDIELPVNERREWASGALGGECRCSRCTWEAGEDNE